MHGYELKQHLTILTGHVRPVSDGSLYPAINRLKKQGFIVQTTEVGKAAAQRNVLTLTNSGEKELLHRLKNPSEHDISDRNRFFTFLSFLKNLEPSEQKQILEKRLEFLEGGKSFFQANGQPVSVSKEQDLFRKGMILIARETSKIERSWLIETIKSLEQH